VIIYTPSIIPPLASVARQQAYIQGSPLPGPAADPDGWQTLPKVMVYGKLPRQPNVEVECTLSLAKPVIIIVSSSSCLNKGLTNLFSALLYPWDRHSLLLDPRMLRRSCPRASLDAQVSRRPAHTAGTLYPGSFIAH